MNRRGFISLLAGAAGAPLVPWRGLIEPVIVLAGRPHICDSPWAHALFVTAESIAADIERCLQQLLRHSGPVPYSHDGLHLIQAHIGDTVRRLVPPTMSFKVDGRTFTIAS